MKSKIAPLIALTLTTLFLGCNPNIDRSTKMQEVRDAKGNLPSQPHDIKQPTNDQTEQPGQIDPQAMSQPQALPSPAVAPESFGRSAGQTHSSDTSYRDPGYKPGQAGTVDAQTK